MNSFRGNFSTDEVEKCLLVISANIIHGNMVCKKPNHLLSCTSLTGYAVLPCYSTTPIEQSKVIAEFVKNDQMATRGHLFSTTTNKSEIQSKLTIFNLASKQGGIF